MLCKIKPVLNLNDKENKTLMFAAKELQRYLKMVICEEIPVMATQKYEPSEGVLFLGTNLAVMPEVADKVLDDAICIDVENFSGLISGTNSRSVLIGVYRFLKEKGFKFIRPGKDGEAIPGFLDGTKVRVLEKASYRHRGVCIEGSGFQENLNEIIDWLPKAAMNEYFFQGKLPVFFFNRWYGNPNPYGNTPKLTTEEIEFMVKDAENEMKIRGILYHAVGHGWVKSVLGLEGNSPDGEETVTEKQKSIMAEINGVRGVAYGSSHNTNLCYSMECVQKSLEDDVVSYCTEHPGVDYLHFWLADGCNNHCECENCRDTRPSDFYVKMLNSIDEKLTQKGLDTKVVFLLYYDLMWKPIVEKFKNHNRFTLMFAPISRSYSKSYDVTEKGKMTEFVRNKLTWPTTVGDCLEYLRDWQMDFKGDSFVYDYHFIWDHYYEFPQYHQAKVLSGDIKALGDAGINGFMSCQAHRVFTPTCLGMNVLADTLWNKEISFDAVCKNVLKAEFGEKWESVRDYLDTLSSLGAAKCIRNEEDFTEVHRENLIKSQKVIEDFMPVIEPELTSKFSLNWQKLKFFGEVYSKTIDYILVCGEENDGEVLAEVTDFVYRNEYRFRDVFDGFFYNDILSGAYADRLKTAKGIKSNQ